MRLLLDEDSQTKLLVQSLRDAGHDVETVTEMGMAGQSDPSVFAYAIRTVRVLLTRNGKDFLLLHKANREHPGILVEYQDSDPTKNMTYAQIASAVTKIEASGLDLTGQFLSINPWQ